MKTRILLFWALTISTVVYSQLKVDNLGHIGMGTNYPNSGYRLHIKGDVLLTNYPEVPWYEFQLKVGQKDGAVIGCTSGIIDFYTSNTGYNKLIAKQYKTHATWDKGHQPLEKGLSIILALNPYYNIITEVHDKVEKEQYGIEPAELFSLTPGIIDVNEDGYAIDYNQLIPILVGAIKEQQKQIELLWTLASHPDKTTLDTLLFNDQSSKRQREKQAMLFECFPNPFNEDTKISMYVPKNSNSAQLCIYNNHGQQIKSHVITTTGVQTITINGSDLPPGLYYYTLIIDNTIVDTKKMILLQE